MDASPQPLEIHRLDGQLRLLSEATRAEDIVRGYSLGANAYVRKPVDFAEFVIAARTLGLFWLLLNESPPAGHPSP